MFYSSSVVGSSLIARRLRSLVGAFLDSSFLELRRTIVIFVSGSAGGIEFSFIRDWLRVVLEIGSSISTSLNSKFSVCIGSSISDWLPMFCTGDGAGVIPRSARIISSTSWWSTTSRDGFGVSVTTCSVFQFCVVNFWSFLSLVVNGCNYFVSEKKVFWSDSP